MDRGLRAGSREVRRLVRDVCWGGVGCPGR